MPTSVKQSNSSARASLIDRLKYLWDLFMMRYRGRRRFDNSKNIARASEYVNISQRHGINLQSAQILEIGVGQRPYLGITLLGLGFDYCGLDLDQPIYPPSLGKLVSLYKANGGLRLLKTLLRFYLFDRKEYAALFRQLRLSPDTVRRSGVFVQANAATINLGVLLSKRDMHEACLAKIPLVIVSESVFEHVPLLELEQILLNIKGYALNAGRRLLLLARPTVYTGICGSHLTEWYHHNVYSNVDKKSEPWEHLRKNRFSADTYLNCMTRADYRTLFARIGFQVLGETVEHPGLGQEFLLDPQLRSELSCYPDDELLSNEVMFELVPFEEVQTRLA